MARRLLRLLLTSGLLLAAAVLVRRTMHLRDEATRVVPSRDPWTPILDERPQPVGTPVAAPEMGSQTDTSVVVPVPDATSAPVGDGAAQQWLAPVDGACPPTHIIKAKVASGIYHVPGMLNYGRTKPDRCYPDEAAAEADGFTKAKR